MIHFLQGKILFKENTHLTLGVGSDEQGYVGYSINCSERVSSQVKTHERISLYVYTHVREDVLELFGFLNPDEKKLFLMLISVNGIGPKGALAVLGHLEPSLLLQYVLEKNKAELTKCPGIGKKTAERLVLELFDPIEKKLEKGELLSLRKGVSLRSSGAQARIGQGDLDFDLSDSSAAVFNEARLALMGLGFKESETEQLLKKALKNSSFLNQENTKVEEVIKEALKQRGV